MGREERRIARTRLIIEENPEDLAAAAAGMFESWVQEAVKRNGVFTAAISGGASPRRFYRLLAEEPYRSRLPWQSIHIFWVDERCVPANDPSSNYGTAKRDFIDGVPISDITIHPMPSDLIPENGARRYEEELRDFFRLRKGAVPAFDLILLGMGTDGHTASLFPGQEVLFERERLVIAVQGGESHVSRLTMTLPVLNGTRRAVFLVAGGSKAERVREIFTDDNSSDPLPACLVQPYTGELIWFLDRDVAAQLP